MFPLLHRRVCWGRSRRKDSVAGEVGAARGRSAFEIPVMGGALGGSGMWGKLSHWGKLPSVLPRAPVDENLSVSSSGVPMLPPGRCFGGSVSILEWSWPGEMLLAGNLGSNLSSVLASVGSLGKSFEPQFPVCEMGSDSHLCWAYREVPPEWSLTGSRCP